MVDDCAYSDFVAECVQTSLNGMGVICGTRLDFVAGENELPRCKVPNGKYAVSHMGR